MKISKSFGFFFIFVSILILLNPTYGEEKSLFSIDDYFAVVSMNVADMTEDGQWLACTQSTRGDSLPRDNYRYGDPTYTAPFQLDVIVLNTETGEQIKLFDQKKQVRSLTWSQDGKMLAFFIYENGAYRISIWNRLSRNFEDVEVKQEFPIASNSHLAWSPEGDKIFFSVRDPEWNKKSAELFQYATNGPVIIHDSEEPFLLWDKMRNRLGNLMIPVVWDRNKKKLTKLFPETLLNSVRISKDGNHMIFERDVTEKTDYDVRKSIYLGRALSSSGNWFVHPDSPFRSVKDLKTYGKSMRYSAFTYGSPETIVAMVVADREGWPLKIIGGYKGALPSALALVRGDVDLTGAYYGGVGELARAGKIRAILTMGPKRVPEVPDVPTVGEIGHPDLEIFTLDTCLHAPPGVPKDRIEILENAFMKTLQDPEFVQWAKGAKLNVAWLNGAETTKRIYGLFDVLGKYKGTIEKYMEKK